MKQVKRVLILCTGNSCRSQMAEGILKSFSSKHYIVSAGTNISDRVHPKAIKVMKEIGIDISNHYPKSVDQFLSQSFDFLITVCDSAKESCPTFYGPVKHRLHIGFEDPAKAEGTEEEVMNVFRKVRDEIYKEFKNFYEKYLA
ncbi:MAG: arsenate reductase ArsC [Leptospiraceae bacterium]|nr:arsenate reductase ArsC [Leptospiraceae bacterium]MDW7976750.1 arsenate reductase ArsC [Leptospiraceae bacterium]